MLFGEKGLPILRAGMRKGFLGTKVECLHGTSLGEQRGGLNQPHQRPKCLAPQQGFVLQAGKDFTKFVILSAHSPSPIAWTWHHQFPFCPQTYHLPLVTEKPQVPGGFQPSSGVPAAERGREGEQGRLISARCHVGYSALVKHLQLGCRGRAVVCYILAPALGPGEALGGMRRGGEPVGERRNTAECWSRDGKFLRNSE